MISDLKDTLSYLRARENERMWHKRSCSYQRIYFTMGVCAIDYARYRVPVSLLGDFTRFRSTQNYLLSFFFPRGVFLFQQYWMLLFDPKIIFICEYERYQCHNCGLAWKIIILTYRYRFAALTHTHTHPKNICVTCVYAEIWMPKFSRIPSGELWKRTRERHTHTQKENIRKYTKWFLCSVVRMYRNVQCKKNTLTSVGSHRCGWFFFLLSLATYTG